MHIHSVEMWRGLNDIHAATASRCADADHWPSVLVYKVLSTCWLWLVQTFGYMFRRCCMLLSRQGMTGYQFWMSYDRCLLFGCTWVPGSPHMLHSNVTWKPMACCGFVPARRRICGRQLDWQLAIRKTKFHPAVHDYCGPCQVPDEFN